jgi:hypothetical protein
MRKCDDCGLCCKLLDVPGLAKLGEWCSNASPGCLGGCCTIHKKRPVFCQKYECLWRLSNVLGDELKPNRCGVVFEAYHEEHLVTALIDNAKTLAEKKGYRIWTRGPVRLLIERMLQDGYSVWILDGGERHLLLAPNDNEISVFQRSKRAWERKVIRGK